MRRVQPRDARAVGPSLIPQASIDPHRPRIESHAGQRRTAQEENLVSQIIIAIGIIIVARILTPEQMGIYGLSFVISGFFNIFRAFRQTFFEGDLCLAPVLVVHAGHSQLHILAESVDLA